MALDVALLAVHLLSHVHLFVTPWAAACQVSLSFTISWIFIKLTSIESAMLSYLLILCRPLSPLALNLSIRIFSSESALCIRWSKYGPFSISPSSEYPGLISFRADWFDLHAVQETLKLLLQNHNLRASILQHPDFFMVQFSHLYMTTGKTIALTIQKLRTVKMGTPGSSPVEDLCTFKCIFA